MTGIRAEVQIHSPPECLPAQVAESADSEAISISKTAPEGSDTVTEEFILTSDADPGWTEADDTGRELTEVFSYEMEHAYRFDESRSRNCPCKCIEQFSCPILDVHARKGTLVITFHAPDIDTLRDVVTKLHDSWDGMAVQRLMRSDERQEEPDLVLVDRSDLTDRQREVVMTAHEMRYFEHGTGANARDVAEEMGINPSTFAEHLSRAQRKMMSAILKRPSGASATTDERLSHG